MESILKAIKEENLDVPKHIAIILDGNGRWAKKRNMPRNYGHVQGSKTVEQIIEDGYNMGIEYITVYAFSTENWRRSAEEVDALMKLLAKYLIDCIERSTKNNMKVRVIGDKSGLDTKLVTRINELEETTKDATGLKFTIAINYGGRDEIKRAVQKIAEEAAAHTLDPKNITEELISSKLDTSGLPDPDLLIRTSGEERLSNFLPWQLAYTEFYFTNVLWPDFKGTSFWRGIVINMKDRLIGGFFVAVITLITLLAGGAVSAVILTIISLFGVWEFLKVYSLEKTPFAIVDYMGTLLFYPLIYLGRDIFLFPLVIFLLMISLAIYVFLFPKYKDTDIIRAFFGFVYVTVLLSFVFRIRSLESGLLLSFFILISSWGNDVFAYLVGSAIGKHKFSPKVSPNKSVEGFVGGILGAGVIGFLFGHIFSGDIQFSGLYCAIIAALGAVPAVVGDLAASAIKRDNKIKDYSHLIPGHGGILDRFDSVFFTAPITYYLVALFNLL